MDKYKVLIGLEMHCEISETNTKVFSSAANSYSDVPNSNIRPVDMAFPGTLPVVNKKKVENVSKKLNIPYINFAKKPLKMGFLKTKKELKEEADKIGVVGDQIFTDIVGGNRCNMFTILVDPIEEKDFFYTAWKRPLENKIKSKIQKTKHN